MSLEDKLVDSFCFDCFRNPCECSDEQEKEYEKKRKKFEEDLDILIQKKRDIEKKKIDKLMKFTDRYGTKWLRYTDVVKLLEEL